MKKTIIIFISVFAFTINLVRANLIQEYTLEKNVIYPIPLHPDITATIQFPAEIEGLKGIGFISSGNKESSDFVCTYNPGDNYFSMMPLSHNVSPRNLNVILNKEIYVLKPYIVDNPSQASVVVKFKNKKPSNVENNVPSVIEKKTYITFDNKNSSINQLISIIDLLKIIGSYDPEKAKEVVKKFPQMEYKEAEEKSLDYGLYSIYLKSTIRNKSADALGFCFVVENQSTNDLILDPESLSVRVGDHIYHQAISDLQPILKSGKIAVGYFVIQGDGEGHKNYLNVNNEFKISLDILSPKEDENL